MKSAFSQRIKSLRKQHNYTQTELAELLGVGRTCVSNWESGLRVPDVDSVAKLSAIFGVNAEYLVFSAPLTTVRPESAGIDISKLSDYGVEKLKEYYKTLLYDKKCVKRY